MLLYLENQFSIGNTYLQRGFRPFNFELDSTRQFMVEELLCIFSSNEDVQADYQKALKEVARISLWILIEEQEYEYSVYL